MISIQDDIQFDYKYGFSMPEKSVFKAKKGLDESVVRQISKIKGEPAWMTEFRLKSYKILRFSIIFAQQKNR